MCPSYSIRKWVQILAITSEYWYSLSHSIFQKSLLLSDISRTIGVIQAAVHLGHAHQCKRPSHYLDSHISVCLTSYKYRELSLGEARRSSFLVKAKCPLQRTQGTCNALHVPGGTERKQNKAAAAQLSSHPQMAVSCHAALACK